jgi:hypothetical protein
MFYASADKSASPLPRCLTSLCGLMIALMLLGFCALALAAPPPVGQIPITVAAPAGPPPLGAPVVTSVPFAKGQLKEARGLAVIDPAGKAASAQFEPTMRWPDGSIRWLELIFEAQAGPGKYYLTRGKTPPGKDLLKEAGGQLLIDTGSISFALNGNGSAQPETVSATDAQGKTVPLMTGGDIADLVMTRSDGKVFKSSLDMGMRKIFIEERGPVRASVRLEGICRAEEGEGLFNYIVRWQAYAGRPEISLTVTWINATDKRAEKIRDLRVVFPYQFPPDRLIFGAQTGVYDGPWVKDWPVYILQEDQNQYWARATGPSQQAVNLATGGANGEHFPGWLYLTQQKTNNSLGVFVPNFWQEYPNEIQVKDGEMSVGLWPERAAQHLLGSKPLLTFPAPDAPRGGDILPHPYLAFMDADSKCMNVPQGVAKTQDIIISPWAGQNAAYTPFEKKCWLGSLRPVRGFVDPRQVAMSGAVGLLWPRDTKNFPEVEKLYDEAFNWFDRQVKDYNCYGKFDYGDYRYMIPSTDYIVQSRRTGGLGEMAREGYWHNNERDPLRGVLLYYLRTGDPRAWELCQAAARHTLDVDLRHYPYFGLFTHSYGHCYVPTAEAGAPDHSWLLGPLEWAGVSGDPVAWQWLKPCGDYLAGRQIDFTNSDDRSTAMLLHMLCQFYFYTGDRKYLAAAQLPAEALLSKQKENGVFPVYFSDPNSVEGATEHCAIALADYYQATGDKRLLEPLKKAVLWTFTINTPFDSSEAPLGMYALATLGEATGDPMYADIARKAYQQFYQAQNHSPDSVGRGDSWAEWKINNPSLAEATGRPPQLIGQSRPLQPGEILGYTPGAMVTIARQEKLAYPEGN